LPLAGGAGAEIINWPGGHSRYLLACSAWAPVTGKVVAGTFLQAGNAHGLPAATLTDNGRARTARFGGGRNAFEYLLAALGITQKNGQPFHPQAQGKAGRFRQTPETLAVPAAGESPLREPNTRVQSRWPAGRRPSPRVEGPDQRIMRSAAA
jgi:transposase InsO family protein